MKLFIKKILFFSSVIISVAGTAIGQAVTPTTIPHARKSIAPQSQMIKTVQSAIDAVKKSIILFPKNAADMQMYAKEQSDLLLRCAKVLYDNARIQILEALSEIDARIAYWQYQKDHPWAYFVSKSPVKWVTGPKQEDEIEANLELLKSHQGELYVLLGQLSEQGNSFSRGYKNIFLTDYTKGYAWIDGLLNTLSRVKGSVKDEGVSSPFVVRAEKLNKKLMGVRSFKNDLLSDVTETEIPSYLARNWLKQGTLLFGLGYAYNKGALDQLKNSFNVAATGFNTIANPVKETINDIFYPGKNDNVDINAIVSSLPDTRKGALNAAIDFVNVASKKYNISKDQQAITLADLNSGGSVQFQKFLELIGSQEEEKQAFWKPEFIDKFAKLPDYAHGMILFFKLFAIGSSAEAQSFILDFIKAQQKQFAGVSKIALLTPAIIASGLAYVGYKKFTTPEFGPIRRALVDINSLFVDQTKALDDEQYGKMIYLVYMLKKRAEKTLPIKNNTRADFIHDLERIESKDFDVAAKRAIVEDMFKKYSFLGLIQKK